MSKKWMLLCFLIFVGSLTRSQQKSVAERLGYDADAKLLIIHADDLGVTHSENAASIKSLANGPVNSASIMVPCPWFEEIAAYARKNKSTDLGLHLTLNSEWKHYKWGPVSSLDKVSSLVNKNGYFYALVDSLVTSGVADEVEYELRNQVKKAYKAGIDVTHLDAHMGAAVSTPDFTAAYMKVAAEFRLPVLLDSRIYSIEHPQIKELLTENTAVVDAIYSASPGDFQKGMDQYYTSVLEKLQSGLNCLLIHLAYDDAEMKAVTIDHPGWGAAWRQADYDFFNSPECAKILKEQNIILVSWRSIRDKITRAN
ncbi:polysaccharide deacetylase family protein [Muriicola sp. Z0-33]|uniref:polysaccharide deacetylase family protein n=1 Tax=Muriicola sp. Z0-33 TaxID=2816957 RepID=UPI002237D1F3|nr:polysaccharide deacetylase family protein [Muriicola sp. Z0-33]MCW5515211.1 polysaccharide deacetylase family protein [Muriicola sp. Z0-33]